MRKKFTMLLMSLLAFVGVARAELIDGNVYSISNKAQNKVISENGENKLSAADSDPTDYNQLWILKSTGDGKYSLRNAVSGHYITGINQMYQYWTATDVESEFFINIQTNATETTPDYYYISMTNELKDGDGFEPCAHFSNGNVVGWSHSNENSQWAFVESQVTKETLVVFVLNSYIDEANNLKSNEKLAGTTVLTNLNSAITAAEAISDNLESAFTSRVELQNAIDAANLYIQQNDIIYIKELPVENSIHPVRISAIRSNWAVADNGTSLTTISKLGLTADEADTKQQFAIITPDEGANYYIYSVNTKRFLKSNNTFGAQGDPIELIDGSSVGENRVVFKFKNNNNGYININSENNIVISGWNDIDNGNACEIVQYNTLTFNLDEAIDIFNNKAVINLTYKLGNKTVTSSVLSTKEETYTIPLYDYSTVTSCKKDGADLASTDGVYAFTVKGDASIDIELEEALPFISSIDYDNATWQVIDMHSNENNYTWKYVSPNNAVETPVVAKSQSSLLEDNFYWAFVGNILDGFKIYNKAAGESFTLRKATNGNTPSVMSETNDRNEFKLKKSASSSIKNAFCFIIEGDTHYLNKQSQKLYGWTSADEGSSCRVFTPASYVLSAFNDIANTPYGAIGLSTYFADKTKHTQFSTTFNTVEENEYDLVALKKLDEIKRSADEAEKVTLTAGYYFIKGTGDEHGDPSYTSYNEPWFVTHYKKDEVNSMKAVVLEEGQELTVDHVWKFEAIDNEDAYKLQQAYLKTYAKLVAAGGTSTVTSDQNGGDKFFFTPETGSNSKFIIKNGDNCVMRTEGDGRINHWSTENNETWYLVPVTDAELVNLCGFVAKVGTEYYETLQGAIDAAEAGATVTLIDDITSSEIIEISKSITLDLGGHTVTGTGNRLFRITAAKSIVTIKNGTIENGVKEGRCVETRAGGINLTLEDLTLTATGKASQPFTVGGHSEENGDVIVTMTSTTVNAGTNDGYAITTFNPVVMTIDNSTVSGWAALNIKEANSSVGSVGSEFSIVNGSELIGVNNAAAAESNNFSTIMIEDSDITFTIDGNSSVARAGSNNSNAQFIFAIGNENVNNEITGLKILVSQGATLEGTILGIDGKQSFAAIETMKVPAEYAGKLQEEGYIVSEAVEGLVEVTGVAVAKVNGVCYATVTEAINAAEDGGTVQLLPGTISEFIAPWTGDPQHKSEKSITIVGAKDEEGNLATTLTGGLFLGYNDGTVRENTITVKELSFEGKGMVVANQKYVVIESNKFTNIENLVAEKHANSNCAILVLGTSKDMCIEATVKNNTINTVNNAGIYLSQVNSVSIEGNTVTNTYHNSLTVSASTTATVEVKNNTFAQWAQDTEKNEGRAVRSSGGNTVKITENVMTYDGEAPEEFVKVSGTTSLDVSANYWNGVNPYTTEGMFLFDKYTGDIVPVIDAYYTNVEKTELVAVGYAELTLIDKEEYTNNRDREVGTLNYVRTFGHNSWQVLFVPFEIPLESMTDFEVYTITGVNSERVTVEEVTEGTTLSAHTPYLIKVQNWTEETKTRTITITDATLKAAPVEDMTWVYGDYTFYGTYAPKAISAMTEYVLTDGQWCQLTETAVTNNTNILGAFRVYLEVPAGTTANALSITRGETGIEELSTVNDQQSTVIYDLTGRKVETMDKGIYIVNGRKVVVK